MYFHIDLHSILMTKQLSFKVRYHRLFWQDEILVLGDVSFVLFFKINLFIYFLAALGLHCCVRAFLQLRRAGATLRCSVWASQAVARLVVEHGLQAGGLQQLRHAGSVVVARRLQSSGSVIVAHELSCSMACGIFLDQGSNPCPLHGQADSQPLHHQGSPVMLVLTLLFSKHTAEFFPPNIYIFFTFKNIKKKAKKILTACISSWLSCINSFFLSWGKQVDVKMQENSANGQS